MAPSLNAPQLKNLEILMKKIGFTLTLIGLFLLAGCNQQPDTYDSQEQPIYLRHHAGKWLVLNYWASWCKPCYVEIPELNRLYLENSQTILVLGINYDQYPAAQLRAFATQENISYPLVLTDIGKKYGINTIPTLPATFIISPDGTIVQRLLGPQTYEDLLAHTQQP